MAEARSPARDQLAVAHRWSARHLMMMAVCPSWKNESYLVEWGLVALRIHIIDCRPTTTTLVMVRGVGSCGFL